MLISYKRKIRKIISESEAFKLGREIKTELKKDKDFNYEFSPMKIKYKNGTVKTSFTVTIIKDSHVKGSVMFSSEKDYSKNIDFMKEKLLEEVGFQEYVIKIFGTNNFKLIRRKCKQC